MPSLITPENLPHVLAAFAGLITAIGGLTVWRAWKEPPKPGTPDAAMLALAENTQALRAMVDAMKSQNTHFADNNEMFKALGPVLSDMRHDGADSKAHLAAIRDTLNREKVMIMKTSDAGLFALALHEGIVPAPYKDSVGVWTYGIGHTLGAGYPDPAKMQRGMPTNLDAALRDVFDLFRRDVAKYEAAVNRAVKVPVTQAQFDALVSFHYNTGAIGRASLVKRLNAGDVGGAAAGFMAWKKPVEIIPRRKAEQELFAKGTYPGGQVTVWQVSNSGRVIWKPARRLSKDQVLALLDGPVAEPHKPAAPPKRPAQIAKPVAPPSPAKEAGKAAAGGLAGGGLALAIWALWADAAQAWRDFWVWAFSFIN